MTKGGVEVVGNEEEEEEEEKVHCLDPKKLQVC